MGAQHGAGINDGTQVVMLQSGEEATSGDPHVFFLYLPKFLNCNNVL